MIKVSWIISLRGEGKWHKKWFFSINRARNFARSLRGAECVFISNRDGTLDFV